MELKLVDPNKMKSLDEYVFMLCTGLMTLQTLMEFHVKAVNLGIFKEDHESRANVIVFDLKRLIALYMDQAESLLEFLPDGFNVQQVMQKLSANEIASVKKLARVKKNES